MSKQFEDHTKNFILKAQERYELQAEKKKQHAKTKSATYSTNKLPASSTTGTNSIDSNINLHSKLQIPSWLLRVTNINNNDEQQQEKILRRSKRQGDNLSSSNSGLNLDSLLDFVKEQTSKLDQVNNQLKSLANSVSQGLDKLRKATNESLVDLQESASQVSREVRTALDTFNSGQKQGETLSDLASSTIRKYLTNNNSDDTYTITSNNNNNNINSKSNSGENQTGSDSVTNTGSTVETTVSNTLKDFQSAWSKLTERISHEIRDLNSNRDINGQSSSVTSTIQG